MNRKERGTVTRWTSWVTFQMLLVFNGGMGFRPFTAKLRQDVETVLYAVHHGMRYFAQGAQPLRPMPDIPAVWPEGYPFELTWGFVEILQQRISEYPALEAAEVSALQQKMEAALS